MNMKKAIFLWAGVSSKCATAALLLLVFLLQTVDPAPVSRFSGPVIIGFCAVVALLIMAGPCAWFAYHVICKADRAAPQFPNIVVPFGESCKVAPDEPAEPDVDDFEWCKIIVNGREQLATEERLSYEDVVRLAGQSGQPTVTFRGPGGLGGSLIPGGDVRVHPGMVFDAVDTGAA